MINPLGLAAAIRYLLNEITEPADFLGIVVDVQWPHREGENILTGWRWFISTNIREAEVITRVQNMMQELHDLKTAHPRMTNTEFLIAHGVPPFCH